MRMKPARRDFLKSLALGSAAMMMPGCRHLSNIKTEGSKRPPNIVMIFTDDQGYADVGCYGAKGFQTPNLDRLAKSGMRFTDFEVAQPVCSPSRAGLLTGCYPNRLGFRGALSPNSKIGLNPEEETIAELLKRWGYATGIFGKWHLGDDRKFLPLQQGFDEFCGLPYSHDQWPVNYDGKPAESGSRKSIYPPLFLIEGNEKTLPLSTFEDISNLTTLYTKKAVQFIRQNQNRPFFLYVPHSMPHVPIAVSDKFRGKSEQGLYGDVVMEIDWSVGEIIKTLEECGLRENTMVVFSSDNGPWLNYGDHAGSAYPLREGKGTIWEGGQRTPCIVSWPGHVPAGTVCTELVSAIDLLPTFCAATDAPLPVKKIDGVNILPLLEGKTEKSPRDQFYYYYVHPKGTQLKAIRAGKWKLHFPHAYISYEGVEPGHDGFPGPCLDRETPMALYNLVEDPGERNNVIEQYPEVVARLQAIAEDAREDLGDFDRKGKGVRPCGRIQ